MSNMSELDAQIRDSINVDNFVSRVVRKLHEAAKKQESPIVNKAYFDAAGIVIETYSAMNREIYQDILSHKIDKAHEARS